MSEVVARGGISELVGISPFERADVGLVTALCDGGALGVLDLGRDPVAAEHALRTLVRRVPQGFGVRVPEGVELAIQLPDAVRVVIAASAAGVARFAGRTVLAQVTSLEEARAALAAGAVGLIAKGSEAGGRIGDETTFVLLQRLIAEVTVPVWAQGGIGLHTAAACIAGGAAGVVLDAQLALVRESTLPTEVQAAIGAMDGSETTVIAGHRVYTRPDLPKPGALDAAGVQARLGGDDLVRCLVPAGQDAAFARSLAKQFPTAAQLVRGVRAAISSHLASAAEHQPLAPGAPLAAAHELRYPIAQGPMSRVSDRARFADAVAAGGGLPFLALTLMTGAEVRQLLEETRALLGDRPWGVGILGFVPPEVREQQLEVIREFSPPVALIAGGRPSQAAPLEAQGTATYLHVPSPGLLELFLRDGARKFVFEGRECGGHVGPRSSFVLWEQQLAILLAHPAPRELSVLFAGGIHDARSAAMVAAMAAPLAAAGGKVGVLMGTAYLFTEEAVSGGAIEPAFQDAAIACERTVLLETAPGHATRCADTAYAEAFAREKQRLEAEGLGQSEVWATLEQLNLGRLRIAAKGLRREGETIAPVAAAEQQREGMYMIGQVAALRRGRCTVAELHHEVSARGSELLAAAHLLREDRNDEGESASRGADIAVIGLAAIFAGAPDTDAFWTNIVTGKNSITEVPPERWSAETYYDPSATGTGAGKKTPSKWGGFLDDIAFDPLTYGIPPTSLPAIEPVQLLSLEIARRAIADAGYAERTFDRSRTSVIFGAEAGTDLSSAYSFRALYPHYVGPMPAGLDEALPTLSEDSFPGVLSNVIAGRIANRLDLGGVNYTVDAACAASLAAVDMAVKELVSGSSDMVLCGGADLHNSISDYLLFSSVHALSPRGQCHTFDADADGIVLGEGVACVVLKRLADAERDGDRIYAVLKGVGGASDGKSLGLTAPRKDGQKRALERAYHQAGLSPAEVGLVEAHGTGTVVGDKTELATLTEIYGRAGAEPGSCVLGSVKSQIGHTKCAAGMAGLIKAALAIHHGVLPPTLNIKQPNPAWQPDSSPFRFLDQARPWTAEHRVAGVSAFGFGGTNFHAVLASHAAGRSAATRVWPSELLVFRGTGPQAAVALVERVQQRLARGDVRLRDLARTVCAAGTGPVQLAIVADSIDDLRGKLAQAKELRADKRGVFVAGGGAAGAVAFLCPGQGSQKPGMLADLFVAFPRLHRLLELGAKWAPLMLPSAAYSKDERAAQAAALTDTRVAQPALGMADLAMAELLQSLGVRPEMIGGHSYGELAALCIAGALDEADLLALSEARGKCILEAAGADAGTMAAVAADPAEVAKLINGSDVVIANYNSPGQCVLSGGTAAVEAAVAKLGEAGLTARRIPVACAFHSPLVAGARDALARELAAIAIAEPRLPVWSNVTAEPYAPGKVRELLADQVARPVRFAHQIESMYAAGARTFVETGPGQVLTRLVGEILGDRPHVAVACDTGGPGVPQLLRALAALAVAGVPVDPAALFWDRDAAILELEPPPAAKGPSANWLVNGHTARPANGAPAKPAGAANSVKPATTAVAKPAAAPTVRAVAAEAAPVGERDGVVVEYLRNMRALIGAQRDVMLAYLGQPAAAIAPAAHVHVIDVPIAAAIAVEEAPAPPPPAAIDPMQLVVSIVSERTGYPVETLGVDLDLEADLSIDSIKRIEIIGELAQRLGLRVEKGAGDADAIVEELATRKTLRALVGWLSERLAKPAADSPPPVADVPGANAGWPIAPEPVLADSREDGAPWPSSGSSGAPSGTAPSSSHRDSGAPAAGASSAPAEVAAPRGPVNRYRLQIVGAPLPINGHTTFAGKRFAIHGGAELAAELAGRLADEGAFVRCLTEGDAIATAGDALDGYIELAIVDSIPAMRAAFERIRAAVLAGATSILAATCHGAFGRGTAGVDDVAGLDRRPSSPGFGRLAERADRGHGGVAGLVKTLAAEYPKLHARVVDLDSDELSAATLLHAELHAADGYVEIGYVAGARSRLEVVPAELGAPGAVPLDADSIVLITGGARGITAKAAIALARRYGCRIELVGRSPLPGPEDAELAAARDTHALRKLFLGRETVITPALIEQRCARVLADREIRATLAALGDRATYHAVDVRDPAFGQLIDELYRTRGRIDAVIHGAGVLEDKLIRHKTGDSFERVYATKLAGARTIIERLRDDVRLVVMFSSISGAFGNRGQADYAAAGDALDKLAWQLQRRISGRVVSIDWGPWAGAGMVSPELEREYARRGIGLIDPDAGVEALLAELAAGSRDDAQVILTASDPRALVQPRASDRAVLDA